MKKWKKKKGIREAQPKKAWKIVLIVFCVLLILALLAVGAFFFLQAQGKKKLSAAKKEAAILAPEEAESEEDGKSIIYKGEKYCYNEHVISILCMGIDTSLSQTGEDNIGENGQADTLVLAVLDSGTGKLSLINISRDAMVDVNKYNVEGQFLGTEKMQICLAYAYGDGKETSCKNTVEAVSRLMYGMPIDAYAAIDYNGIGVLNDAVGGVTVEVLEDLTLVDPQLKAGEMVTLKGEQAHSYVRSRNTELLESNNLRMARQKQYMLAFLKKAIQTVKSDPGAVLSLYRVADDFMVTDIGSAEAAYLASLFLDTGVSEDALCSVPGEVIQGEVYAEFVPDDEALYELILNVFYEKEDK